MWEGALLEGGPKWEEVRGGDARIIEAHTGVHFSDFLRDKGMGATGVTWALHLYLSSDRHFYSPCLCLDPCCTSTQTPLFAFFFPFTLKHILANTCSPGGQQCYFREWMHWPYDKEPCEVFRAKCMNRLFKSVAFATMSFRWTGVRATMECM